MPKINGILKYFNEVTLPIIAMAIPIIGIAGVSYFEPGSIMYFVSVFLVIFGAFALATCILFVYLLITARHPFIRK